MNNLGYHLAVAPMIDWTGTSASGSPRGHVAAEEIGQFSGRRDVELDHIHGALDRSC
jgi:hypothetical protein